MSLFSLVNENDGCLQAATLATPLRLTKRPSLTQAAGDPDKGVDKGCKAPQKPSQSARSAFTSRVAPKYTKFGSTDQPSILEAAKQVRSQAVSKGINGFL